MNVQNDNGNIKKIPPRVLSSLLASISAGVVPREGAPYIAIGRKDEIAAVLSDLEQVNDGGGSMRFLIGRYGSGKSFLIQLIRGYSLEKGFITADFDLTPERRLHGSAGSGVASYRELMKNMASKSSPDGGALPKIIARWIGDLQSETVLSGIESGSQEFQKKLDEKIFQTMRKMETFVGGFDFARVIVEYYHAYTEADEDRKSACMRWLRGEYANKTEARQNLGFSISTIIGDDNWYDFLKLWASLVRQMGYRGLVVFIDECVNLYKIPHRISRENNYEKILSMFNDTLQGKAPGMEIILGGTPQFLEDTRRGLYSYEALRSRLSDSKFSLEGYKNLIGPVIRLRRLTDEELYALICRVTMLHEQNYKWTANITDEEKIQFLTICLNRAGADAMITPREMLRDYMTVLNILLQNPNASFSHIVKNEVKLKTDKNADNETKSDNEIKTSENTNEKAQSINSENKQPSSPKDYTLDDLNF